MCKKTSDKIAENVVSPFSDAMIGALIKRFIECGLDRKVLYSELQDMESEDDPIEFPIDSFLQRGHFRISAEAPSQDCDFLYDEDSFWLTLRSEEDPLQTDRGRSDGEHHLTYRIVLNLTGKDKGCPGLHD